jgi:hypothetical protein
VRICCSLDIKMEGRNGDEDEESCAATLSLHFCAKVFRAVVRASCTLSVRHPAVKLLVAAVAQPSCAGEPQEGPCTACCPDTPKGRSFMQRKPEPLRKPLEHPVSRFVAAKSNPSPCRPSLNPPYRLRQFLNNVVHH